MDNPAYKVAKELKNILSTEDYKLKPHYHEQLNGPWYLIPPQFKTKKMGSPYCYLGKFSFSVEKDELNLPYLFIGVHVEKGSPYSTPTEDFWFWNTFMKRVKDGTFEHDLQEISNVIQDKIIIQIDANLGEGKKKDTDHLVYYWENGKVSRQDSENTDSLQVLKELPPDSEGIKKILNYTANEEWAWVDVYFGVGIPLEDNKRVEEEANKLWFKGLYLLQNYATE